MWKEERKSGDFCLYENERDRKCVCAWFICIHPNIFSAFPAEGGSHHEPPPSTPTHTPVCNTVVLTLPGIAPPNETSVFVFILSSCVSENIQHGEKLYRKDRMRKREESWKRRNRKNTSLNFSDSFFFQSALKFKWAIPWKSKAQTGVEALWC